MAAALLLLSASLAGIALFSLRFQFRAIKRLRTETMASEDRKYLRGVVQRRSLNAVLILALAGMLAGAYFSGGFDELARISAMNPEDRTDEDKQTVKSLAMYWIIVLGLLFFVLAIAMADYIAVGMYGRQEWRRIQREQRGLLERDLAVLRQQKLNNRMKRLS